MPSLSAIKRPDLVTVDVVFGGEVVKVTFNRNAMTQRWVKQIQQGMEAEDVETAARSLVELLTAWDIVNEDGSPVPITVDVLADLPLPFIGAIDAAIGEAGTVSRAEGNASSPSAPSPSSDSTQTPENSPNGSQTSTSPNVSASVS